MKYCDKRADAGITIFFALISAVIFALFLGVLESARMSAARLHMRIAANSSIDSLFSQYHKKLWQDYRILGLEQYDYEQLTDEMQGFMEPYFKAKDWFPMKLDSIDITELISITDENGAVFEEEVLDYMKYGIAASISDITELELFEKSAHEGKSIDKISEFYEEHAGEAASIEKLLSRLSETASQAGDKVKEGRSALNSCDGEVFIDLASSAISELEKLPGLIEEYEKEADKLAKSLEKTKAALKNELENGELSYESWQVVNDDIEQFDSYVRSDGERRAEIKASGEKAVRNIDLLRDLIEDAEEVLRYIAEWEPEDDEDELDEEALWRPLIARSYQCEDIVIGCRHGMQDEESEKKLESIRQLLSGELLKLVLPKGAKLSSEKMDLTDCPGALHAEDDINRLSLIDRAYVAEYAVSELSYFGRGVYDDKSKKGSGGCELEYVLYGYDNDTENLNELVKQLTAFRSGMNLIYLYSDNEKKAEARTLAAAITGAAGITPLISVMTFFILSVWALGQAVMDVKGILAGYKVPIMHNKNSFDLSLSGLMSLSADGVSNIGVKENKTDKGLLYRDYLRILMFSFYGSSKAYRVMDIIQVNLRKAQGDFRMDRLVYSMQADVNVSASHLFSELGIVKAFVSSGDKNYKMRASTAFSY